MLDFDPSYSDARFAQFSEIDLVDSNNIDNLVQEIANNGMINQETTLDVNVKGDNCFVGNKFIMRLTAQSMIDSTMNCVFHLTSVRDYVADISVEQKNRSKGLFSASSKQVLLGLGDVIVLSVLVYLASQFFRKKGHESSRRRSRDDYEDDVYDEKDDDEEEEDEDDDGGGKEMETRRRRRRR